MSEKGFITIRASSTPAWPDCERRSAAVQFKHLIIGAGFTVRDRRNHIGAVVGGAVHAGAGFMLDAKMQSGELGNLSEAQDRAQEEMRYRLAEAETIFDATTEKVPTAQRQIQRMVKSYRSFAEDLVPEGVEKELKADLGDGFLLVGHGDLFTRTDAAGRDLKTGTVLRSNLAQYGTYDILARANDMMLLHFWEDYLPRVRLSAAQPPVESTEIDQVAARNQAVDTILRMKTAVQTFEQLVADGDDRPERAFQANPMSVLCSPKFCPAFGSDFCTAHKSGDLPTEDDLGELT